MVDIFNPTGFSIPLSKGTKEGEMTLLEYAVTSEKAHPLK